MESASQVWHSPAPFVLWYLRIRMWAFCACQVQRKAMCSVTRQNGKGSVGGKVEEAKLPLNQTVTFNNITRFIAGPVRNFLNPVSLITNIQAEHKNKTSARNKVESGKNKEAIFHMNLWLWIGRHNVVRKRDEQASRGKVQTRDQVEKHWHMNGGRSQKVG